MKKFLVLAAVVLGLGVTSANAQAGKVYIGTTGVSLGQGTVQAFDGTGKMLITGFQISDKYTAFGLAPELGYFVSDNLALGIGLGFTSISGDAAEASGDKGTAFGVAPYLRWFAHKSGAFSFYVQGGLDYANIKLDGQDAVNSFRIGVLPGVAYGLSEHFSINANFGWLGYSKVKDVKGTFALDVDMNTLGFGLSYIF